MSYNLRLETDTSHIPTIRNYVLPVLGQAGYNMSESGTEPVVFNINFDTPELRNFAKSELSALQFVTSIKAYDGKL